MATPGERCGPKADGARALSLFHPAIPDDEFPGYLVPVSVPEACDRVDVLGMGSLSGLIVEA